MESSSTSSLNRQRVRLVVFSITAEWDRLREVLHAECGNDEICVMTPHLLFPSERDRVFRENPRVRIFRTFHDLLDQEDMEFCDAEADRRLMARRKEREGRVEEYYAEIMQLKNERAVRNLLLEFEGYGRARWFPAISGSLRRGGARLDCSIGGRRGCRQECRLGPSWADFVRTRCGFTG